MNELFNPLYNPDVDSALYLNHDTTHHTVSKNLGVNNHKAHFFVGGFPEGAGQWSTRLNESTDPLFTTFDQVAHIYLGANPFAWPHTDENLVFALTQIDAFDTDVTLISGGTYFTLRNGELLDSHRFSRLRLLSPALGKDTVKVLGPLGPHIARIAYNMPETHEFIERFIKPVADEGIPIDYYLGKDDPIVDSEKTAEIAQKVHQGQENVKIHYEAFQGHMPHINHYLSMMLTKY